MCSTAVSIVVVAKQFLLCKYAGYVQRYYTANPPQAIFSTLSGQTRCLSQSSHDLRVPNGYFTDSKRVNFNNMMLQFFEFVLGFHFFAKATCDFCKILEHFHRFHIFWTPNPQITQVL